MPLKFDREPYEAMTIDMTPMVDAIFAIILFLLVTSSFIDSMEQDLSIELPTQSRETKVQKPPARPVVVNVRFQGGAKPAFYHIEGEAMSLAQMVNALSRAKVRNPDQAVVIRGDRSVRWEHVAAVMSVCAQAGITKVSATVEVKDQP